MVAGIDFGSTLTKIVLIDGDRIVGKDRIKRGESVEDLLSQDKYDGVSKIMISGTGSVGYEGDILGIPTVQVPEFQATAKGALCLSGKDECVVVSVGTGTLFLHASKEEITHIGGAAIGGAALLSLAGLICDVHSANELYELALKGDIGRTDLRIADVAKEEFDDLTNNVTVANMGKLTSASRVEDKALGICNLIFQNIGVMAVFDDRKFATGCAVMIGTTVENELAKRFFGEVGDLFGMEFVVPKDASYAVAIGAALQGV